MDRFPQSIAIAGAWGYIGRKFLDAALGLGLRTYVFDPGDPPDDVDLDSVTRVDDEDAFYALDADLFHLALHPEHRRRGEQILLRRAAREKILILNEKPMATPGDSQRCLEVVEAVERSGAPVRAVAGSPRNRKITTPEDLAWAESVLPGVVSA